MDPSPPAGIPLPNANHCAQRGVNNTHAPALTTCTLVLAGFYLSDPVKGDSSAYAGQYLQQNAQLINTPMLPGWFNLALINFQNTHTNTSLADLQRHFPWPGTWNGGKLAALFDWGTYVYPQAVANPFLGQFSFVGDPNVVNDARPDHFLYPRRCTPTDLTRWERTGVAPVRRQL